MDDTTNLSELLCLYLAAGIALVGLALGGYAKSTSRRSPRPWRDGETGPGPWSKPPEPDSPTINLEEPMGVAGAGTALGRPATVPVRLGGKLIKRALRRKGDPTPVQVSVMDVGAQPFEATVSDRSSGGLCLLLPQSVSVGTLLRVRSTQYEDYGPWVEIEVRYCRQDDDHWLAGCKYKEKLPLNVLLLFG